METAEETKERLKEEDEESTEDRELRLKEEAANPFVVDLTYDDYCNVQAGYMIGLAESIAHNPAPAICNATSVSNPCKMRNTGRRLSHLTQSLDRSKSKGEATTTRIAHAI